jgi:cytochrome P450
MIRARTFDPPAELWKAMHTGRPLHRLRFRGDGIGWLVTGYREACAVLKDPRFSLREWPPLLVEDPDKHATYVNMMEETGLRKGDMLTMDPPEHTTLRRALAPVFTFRGLRQLELPGKVDEIVVRCLDRMEASGPPVDLVESFAVPVSQLAHCALLGVPGEDAPFLQMIGETVTNPALSAEEVVGDTKRFRDYLREIVDRKRSTPGNDLITHIVESGELTEDQLLGVLVMLFIAGVESTESALSTGVFALLCHPDQLEALRGDPSLIDAAVEELNRYLTVLNVGAITRTALEDVELGGTVIRAGEHVSVSLLAANRDALHFAHPHELDLRRVERGHLGFGTGVHMCVGQHLARFEMRAGLAGLLERFPDLRLAVPAGEVPLSGEFEPTFRVRRLPVTW